MRPEVLGYTSCEVSCVDEPAEDLTLRTGVALSGLDIASCWLSYVAMGGGLSYADYDLAVFSGASLCGHEHDVAAHALNEILRDQDLGSPVAYTQDLTPG
jgi:hypothetical protein